MRRYVTYGDLALVGILMLLTLVSFGGMRFLGLTGSHAVVEVDGRRVLELPLDRDARASVRGPRGETVIVIVNRSVQVESSPCPHGHCMHMGRIRRAGEILVCVPNRVFVTIRSSGKNDWGFDGVSE